MEVKKWGDGGGGGPSNGADFEMGGWYPFTDYAVWIDKPNENLLQCLTRKQQKDTLTFPGNGCKKEKNASSVTKIL